MTERGFFNALSRQPILLLLLAQEIYYIITSGRVSDVFVTIRPEIVPSLRGQSVARRFHQQNLHFSKASSTILNLKSISRSFDGRQHRLPPLLTFAP